MENASGYALQIPNETEARHEAQDVVGDIDFPPEETLARRILVVMVVVVPAFTEREQCDDQAVFAVVLRFISATAN